MNPTETMPVSTGQAVTPAILTADRLQPTESLAPTPQSLPRRAGYGLPCAKCRTYYAADLAACPVCKSPERVSPIVGGCTISALDPMPSVDPATLEEERERFLREFESQIHAGNLQINASATFQCSKEENHQGAFEPASVCQSCYERLRERVDLVEAALLMDPKEAAQLVYSAVWADPSDPSKTYRNAAQALLNELRRRAGISAVFGSLQPLQH
jgi:hypothetical protein